MELAIQVQILDKAVCVSFCTNSFGNILFLSYGLIVGQMELFNFGMKISLLKESSEFKLAVLCLEN